MIAIGAQEISKIALGEEEIQEAYLGNNLVFSAGENALITASADPLEGGSVTGAGKYRLGRVVELNAIPANKYKFSKWGEKGEASQILPDGYTPLEYIQFGSACGISTEFWPNAGTTRLVMDFQCVSAPSADQMFFGEYSTNISGLGNRWVNMFGVNSTTLGYRDNSSSYGTFSPSNILNRMTLDYNCPEGKISLAGVSKTLNRGTYTLSSYLFFGSPSSTDKIASYRLYSAQIYTNTTKERDFVPCKNPSGVVGLYDTVLGKFHSNAHSGALIAGPEIVWTTVSENAKYRFTVTGPRDLTAFFVSTSRLPNGYTELQYIQFDSKTGFNTGLYVNPATTVVILDIYTAAAYSGSEEQIASMLASKAGSSSVAQYMLSFGRTSDTNIYCRAGATSTVKNLSASITGQRLEVRFDGPQNVFRVGAASLSVSKYNYLLNSQTFYIGAPNNNWKSVPYRLYSAKIYQNSSLSRDFVPCKNPQGAVGLYDLRNGAFYANVLSGTVTAGPAV